MGIPETTRNLSQMLKKSIITLLRAEKDMSIDISEVRIFPQDMRVKEESEDSDDEDVDIFSISYVCWGNMNHLNENTVKQTGKYNIVK